MSISTIIKNNISLLSQDGATGIENPPGSGGNLIQDNFNYLAENTVGSPLAEHFIRLTGIETNYNISHLDIPSIPSQTRHVVNCDFSNLTYPRRACVAFYPSGTTVENIQNYNVPNLLWNESAAGATYIAATWKSGFQPSQTNSYLLIVSEDYTKAARLKKGASEKNQNADVMINLSNNSYALSYSAMNAGCLIGYYGTLDSSSGGGFLYNLFPNRPVILESAWISTSGNTTTLSLALYNPNAGSTSAVRVETAVIE